MILDWLERLEWRNPWWLMLLLVLPYLWYVIRKKSYATDFVLPFPNLEKISTRSNFKIKLFHFLPYLKGFGFIFLILALARPQWILKEEKVSGEGIDIFLTLDLSSSMLSQDFNPNRLEVSKAVAVDFVNQRPYDRIGVIGFSGEGFTQCPLTTDRTILTQLLNQLQCGFLEDGTAIGDGLATAINRLKNDSTKSKIIILLTDGVNNAGDIPPSLAAELAKTFNIKIYAIGVGSTGEAYSPVGRNANGEYVFGLAPVNIDERLLNEIAASTGGRYYRATSIEELKMIYKDIDLLEKTKIEVKVFKRYSEEYRPFAILGLLCFLLQWLLYYIYLKPLPN
jgi:Ca-activated chloride channel homolog